jgi:hypothetical protein
MLDMYAEYFRNPETYFNVLYLDDDPVSAAQQHCDRHVTKMILEAAQILSTVWHTLHPEITVLDWNTPTDNTPPRSSAWLRAELCGQRIYQPQHHNHPCIQWVSLHGGSYVWLYRLGQALLDEYEYRWERLHACAPILRTLELVPPSLHDSMDTWTEAPTVMPSEFIRADAVSSYRQYYRKAKSHALNYTRRQPPEWVKDVSFYKEG